MLREGKGEIIPRWTPVFCVRPMGDLDNKLDVVLLFAHKESGPVKCASCDELFWRAVLIHSRREAILCEPCYELMLDAKVEELNADGFVFHMHNNFAFCFN